MQDWIRPGAQCVCVDGDWEWTLRQGEHELPVRVPMLGEILTIRAAGTHPSRGPDAIFLSFEEVESWQMSGPLIADIWWLSTSFRPLATRATDISALTALLESTPAGLLEEV